MIGYLLFFLYSIGLTHLLRREFHRRGWSRLPLPAAFARMIPAGLLVSAVQTVLVVGVYTSIERRLGEWHDPSSIVYMFIGLSVFDTIWVILYLAIRTSREAREVRQKEAQMRRALEHAELRALEAQLNPHFLFNCLNSIRGMISEDAAQAQDMITRLANILRYNLQRDREHTVPLGREIDAVSDYLMLESIRFEDRLRVHMAVDEAARGLPVPPMILQTLVENAIKHGLEEIAGVDLGVRASIAGEHLRIEVENTGTLTSPHPASTQIGLSNARERLRLLYGERASIQLGTCSEDRVRATVLLPATA